MTMQRGTGSFLAAALALAIAGAATAQEATDADARWLPFVGCWQPVGAESGAMLCVVPTATPTAVELRTYDGDLLTEQAMIRADGRSWPLDAEGCSGNQRAAFSEDGHRVYARTELVCAGRVERSSRRLMAMVATTSWVDIEALDVLGRSLATTQRYVPAAASRYEAIGLEGLLEQALALETARFAALADYTVEDVIDASSQVDPEAVRAWIAERGEPLELDARRLVAMADAGVPAHVIDVAVAVSYPDVFELGREPDLEAARTRGRIPLGLAGGWYDPWGYRYPYYGFSPFYGGGYWGYWGYGGYRGGYPGRVVVVERDRTPRGKVVNGRGYTRGTPYDGGAVRGGSRGSWSSGGSRPTVSRSGWSSGGSRPASRGGSRKAKPRGGSG